jgi:hypothetical protein
LQPTGSALRSEYDPKNQEQVFMNFRVLLGLLLAASVLPIAAFCTLLAQDPTLPGFTVAVAYAGVFALFTFPIALLLGIPLLLWYRANRWHAWYHFAIGGALLGLLPLGVMTLFGRIPLQLPLLLQLVGAGSALVLWAVVGRRPPQGSGEA